MQMLSGHFFVTLGECISPQSWERAVGAPGVGAVAVSRWMRDWRVIWVSLWAK